MQIPSACRQSLFEFINSLRGGWGVKQVSYAVHFLCRA